MNKFQKYKFKYMNFERITQKDNIDIKKNENFYYISNYEFKNVIKNNSIY